MSVPGGCCKQIMVSRIQRKREKVVVGLGSGGYKNGYETSCCGLCALDGRSLKEKHMDVPVWRCLNQNMVSR